MRRVIYTGKARKQLKKLDARTKVRIVAKIEHYAADSNSLAANVKKLSGVPGYRLRIGNWRVIFTETWEVIDVSAIAARGNVYER